MISLKSNNSRTNWFLDRVRTIRNNSSEEGMETGRNLLKWLGLGLVIGIVAGLGAIAFTWAIDFCTHLFLANLAGYTPPSALGEGTATITPAQHPWVFPIVLAFGGLLSGLIVYHLAPEAAGHGTDAAIAAFHQRGGKVRARVPLVKLITSAITTGSGGSGGREGPTAQISAGFGSLLATWLGLDVRERRIAMVAGMGAGIGAIFRAPLGGAVMAAEILYLHDLEVEVLIPGLVASIVGYSVYSSVYGWTPIFGSELGSLTFNNPIQLVYYAALGAICGLIGLLYAKSFSSTDRFFHHLRLGKWAVPNWLKPALGGLLVGLMGIVSPGFIHMGYGWVQATLSPSAVNGLLSLPLWLVLVLPFGKIVASSLSIGSGGSGGIFGPGMVIGGFVGAAFWRITEGWLPGVPTNPAPFVIIAMMALFGGVAHAPLAVMLMVAEMTGNLSLLAPAMVAVAISLLICGNKTIYINQMGSRADSPAHRYRFSFPLLAALPLVEVMQKPFTLLHPGQSIEETRTLLKKSKWSGLPVVDARNSLVGILTSADLEREKERTLTEANKPRTIEKMLNRHPISVEANESLVRVLELMAQHQISWIPVVEDENSHKLSGVIGVAEVVKAYQTGLDQEVRSLGASLNNMSILEVQISPLSKAHGLMLKELQLPEDTLVISIHRRGELIIPRGTTCLQSGDIVRVVTEPGRRRVLQRYLNMRRTDQKPQEPTSAPGTN